MLKPSELNRMKPLLPQELFQELERAASEDDIANAIIKLQKFVEENQNSAEIGKLQVADLEEEKKRLLTIRAGKKPTYSTFKYEKKK